MITFSRKVCQQAGLAQAAAPMAQKQHIKDGDGMGHMAMHAVQTHRHQSSPVAGSLAIKGVPM